MFKNIEKDFLCPVIKGFVFMEKKTRTVRNEHGSEFEFAIKYSCSGASECKQTRECPYLSEFLEPIRTP